MKFYSTKRKTPDVSFKTALFQGIAPDGGLYMPRSIPQFRAEELGKIVSLQDAAFVVLRKWIDAKEISDEDLQQIVSDSFTFPIPLVSVGDFSVLELFNGPTLAFKDIAARVLARLFEFYLKKEKRTLTILVATSGDTGGAIAQAFSGIKRVKVVILYPLGKVSTLQEEQLTRVGKNVLSIAIDGVFDECQQFVKQAFQDQDLKKFNVTSANSINIGRLIPQIIYYVWASRQVNFTPTRFVVPSGNMGNATACLLAQKMGIPISSLVIATNENDAAVSYYKTGIYEGKKTVQTLSTAMDIGKPNNFERILELFHFDHKEFKKFVNAVKVTDKENVSTIKSVYSLCTYLLDFHTAVGFCAAEKVADATMPTIVVSTASPLKFAKEMEEKISLYIDNTQLIKHLLKKKKLVITSENNYEKIKKLLVEHLSEK